MNMIIGDIVCLKSNPKTPITIEGVENDLVVCVWLDNNEEVKREIFSCKMLEKSDAHASSLAEIITEGIVNFINDFDYE